MSAGVHLKCLVGRCQENVFTYKNDGDLPLNDGDGIRESQRSMVGKGAGRTSDITVVYGWASPSSFKRDLLRYEPRTSGRP